ncbi:MAG: hypothetical protein MZV64_18945 [Ignavibacteriales bacterium]|nr:hypothetical protein [Ignavibacteriales bacterium]
MPVQVCQFLRFGTPFSSQPRAAIVFLQHRFEVNDPALEMDRPLAVHSAGVREGCRLCG